MAFDTTRFNQQTRRKEICHNNSPLNLIANNNEREPHTTFNRPLFQALLFLSPHPFAPAHQPPLRLAAPWDNQSAPPSPSAFPCRPSISQSAHSSVSTAPPPSLALHHIYQTRQMSPSTASEQRRVFDKLHNPTLIAYQHSVSLSSPRCIEILAMPTSSLEHILISISAVTPYLCAESFSCWAEGSGVRDHRIGIREVYTVDASCNAEW